METVYVLRVRLSWAKGVWREIAILGSHTLSDLHSVILDAFEWVDNGDTYRFYMSNDPDDITMHFSPNDERCSTKTTCLQDFDLKEDQNFIYVYGDTERNRFPIKVMLIDFADKDGTYPDIVDENGESPEQDYA